MTAVCGVLDAASGRLTYVNCGHNPPAPAARLGRAGVAAAGRAGPRPLRDGGVRGGRRSTSSPATASCSTPTASSSRPTTQDREFGTERLAAAVREAAGRPAAEALRCVIDATRAFAGRDDYDDDFTLVVVQRRDGLDSRERRRERGGTSAGRGGHPQRAAAGRPERAEEVVEARLARGARQRAHQRADAPGRGRRRVGPLRDLAGPAGAGPRRRARRPRPAGPRGAASAAGRRLSRRPPPRSPGFPRPSCSSCAS